MKPTRFAFNLNDTCKMTLLLALVLLGVLLLSGVLQLIGQPTLESWIAPAPATSSPLPTPEPGWWSTIPTAVPLMAIPNSGE